MQDFELQRDWKSLMDRLEARFGEGLDLDAVIFLVGVQELGQGYRTFKKHEKTDLMHIAICRLLMPYGYYEYMGMDEDGWPHYKALAKLPQLNPKQQSLLMKEALLDYFKAAELPN
ncbi:MAG: hypothetical protein H6602_00780 [Flavobacteriales bacterium]|nr:hypothetical protein [Flavobacteriales bacterium]MCB9190185.1 hypothetical protein [Flavobacteriales bacterium]